LGWFERQLFARRYRYTEERLQPYDRISAIGEFRARGGVGVQDPDAELAAVLRRWKQDQAGLLARFDANGDGVIGNSEWEQARAAARESIVSDRLARPVEEKLNVLGRPGDGRSFLLSAINRPALARRFRIQAFASLTGFLAATTTLGWLLIRVW
jgi:hypothetical protein